MAETPVDPGNSLEPKPLGLSLGFIEGSALVSLADRSLADGLVIRALDLELAEVEFPLDLKGGAEEFQRRSTTLRTLIVDIHVELIARALTDALSQTKIPLKRVDVRVAKDRLVMEAVVDTDGRPATFVADVLLAFEDDRTVRLHVLDPMVIGQSEIDAWSVPKHLLDAAHHAMAQVSARSAESLRLATRTTFAIDVADALLWGLMPRHGWKVPHHHEAPIRMVSITPAGFIRVAIGRVPEEVDGAGEIANERDVLVAIARDDIERSLQSALEALDAGDRDGAFVQMRSRLDPSGGPDALMSRLLALGASTKSLAADTKDLIGDLLQKNEDDVRALLAQASMASRDREMAEAATAFERAGRLLKRAGQRRQSGLAFREAAKQALLLRGGDAEKTNVRLLEETIALRPDDTIALLSLVDALPKLGRAPAAVRAARRLANLAVDAPTRVQAHVRAGELLRDPIGDPVQAKRELERALRLEPENERALEALARAVMDQGEPRRAASIFEKLIDRAEADGNRERAARLSVVLGDLWRPIDSDAANSRYRRARELDRTNISALSRLASVALEGNKPEVAMDAVEAALPMLEEGNIGGDRDAALALRLAAGRLYEGHADLLDEAIVQYDAALALAPEATDALLALSRLYERQGNQSHRAEVIDRHAKILAAGGDLDGAAARWIEEAHIHREDASALDRVHGAIQEALTADRGHRGLLDALVETAGLDHDPAKLIDAVDRRLLLEDPDDVRAALLTRLGSAFESAGRVVEAARAFEGAMQADDQSKDAVEALTRIYRSRGDQERLSDVLQRAAALTASRPERADLLAERARLLTAVGRDEEALASAIDSLAASPESTRALPLATSLAIKLGKLDEAKRYAMHRLAACRDKSSAEQLPVYVDLARIAEGLGSRDELIDALEKARDLADPESETGRQLAARLARELYGAERLEELAELQRRRGRVATASGPERAERFIEAARLSARIGQDERATDDIEVALGILGTKKADVELKLTALDVLESNAKKRDDLVQLAEVLGRRSQIVSDVEERERLRLEQADVLERSEAFSDAVTALEAATLDLPSSFAVAERLGRAAQRAGKSDVAAKSYGRAAAIAEERGTVEVAIDMHGRAAETFALIRDRDSAAVHDRALVEHCVPGVRSPWLASAMERLERYGRDKGDERLLAEILGRRAATAEPEDAARMLLEKAEVHVGAEGAEREALDALRRARHLAPAGSAIAEAVDDRLVETLEQLGLFAEQAAVLVERADRDKDASSRASLYFRAAELYADRLRDRGMALSRAQAAVRADPSHDDARALRIKLLRAGGRRDALAEALSEEAELCRDAKRAAELWLEAAEIITPQSELPGRERLFEQREIEHSLGLVRRAATAAPMLAAPLSATAAYARALDRPDEELVALGHLVERDVDPAVRLLSQVRRVDLLASRLHDAPAAQAELSAALPDLLELDPEACRRMVEALPEATVDRLDVARHEDLRVAVLYCGVELTEQTADWTTHVRMLMSLVALASDNETRAELRRRAGGVLEWKLGDGESAEREYLAALALLPNDDRPRKALENFYMAVDRFADIADNLGTRALVDVWDSIKDNQPPNRVISAAEALWPKLDEGGDARAEVQLRLADLYVTRDQVSEGADAVHILEQIVKTAPRRFQDAALERLRVFFLENDRADLYCDVLHRQAERIEDDKARALALAELGEALEWQLGDGLAAENEYRAALAADSNCDEARSRLAKLLSSQDRFEEIGRDLGVQKLEYVLDALLGQGSRDRERSIRAADALAAELPEDQRGALWLRVADAFEFDEGEGIDPAVRVALQRAAATDGHNQKQALLRLSQWLAKAQDRGELANVLRRRVEIERDPELRGQLHLELGRLVMSMLADADDPGREAIEEEAERELRAVLVVEPKNEEARALLERLYLERERHLELGRVLGRDVLDRLRAESELSGDVPRARGVIAALAELSEGTERATLLVELVGHSEHDAEQPGLPRTPEDLYRAALVADEGYGPAQEGLRALLESEGRYRDIAETLDISALFETVEGLRRNADDRGQLLPAMLALLNVLGNVDAPAAGRAALWAETADLHLDDGDAEAAEHALRQAIALMPDHEGARESLRELLVAERRLADLADVDESLLARTAARASESGDIDLQVAALDVLASRKSSEARADTLVLIAALERQRGRVVEAEERLVEALEAHRPHVLARTELETLLWTSERYSDLVDRLGPAALLVRMDKELESSPDIVRQAAEATSSELGEADRAHMFELLARIPDDSALQLKALEDARSLWDDLGDAEGRFRVRMAIVALRRAGDDRAALLIALEGAHAYATTGELRAALAVERASLLTRDDKRADARKLVEPLVADLTLPRAHRAEAARLLVEDLIAPDIATLEDADLELRARSLEVLTELPSVGPHPDEAERWFLELSAAREALSYDTASVAQPLESALGVVSEDARALDIRRRLVGLYEELGDWGQAERHSSVIAEADDNPEQWVQLSELRVWLDDAVGAQSALDRALERDPASPTAHESLIRLAEQTGESMSVITRLEAWAEIDVEGGSEERARRLLRAAKLAIEDGANDKAALLAERAVTLVPRGDPALEPIAVEACAVLTPAGLEDARIAILTRVAQEGDADVSSASRLMLADLLSLVGRVDEARTVIEQGIHRETSEEDPLVDRLIAETSTLSADAAARRLLATAERLGTGPAARRLRMAGAELAESAGEKETARIAWSNLVSEVGAGEGTKAREALVRITRDLDDAPGLLAALEEAALDATTPHTRAAKWAEAAEVANESLDDPDRAEMLLGRAIGELPDDDDLRRRRIELLESRGRFIDLIEALDDEASRTVGMARAKWLERRALLASNTLKDDAMAGELWAEVYAITGQIEHAENALVARERGYDPAGVLAFVESVQPSTPPAQARFGMAAVDALETLGRTDDAIARAETLASQLPENGFVHHQWRALLHRHARWEQLAMALQSCAQRAGVRDGVRWQLGAARIYAERLESPARAEAALTSALEIVEDWLAEPGAAGSSGLSPAPAASANLSERATFDAPLLDLAQLAAALDNRALQVDALRLYAQALSEGPAQWRALLLLASAERSAGDFDAAEFTLRGVVDAVRISDEVSFADRVEAERSFGALLLDRGHVDEAVIALERAAKMLADLASEQDTQAEAARERAQVLVLLASAYRSADRARDAVDTLTTARALAPEEVFEPLLEQAIEAAGPSADLAELLERRAASLTVPRERAAMLLEATRTWERLGQPVRAFTPWIAAHEADASNPKEAVRLQEALYESERFDALEKHIGRRLESEDMTDAERATLLVARSRLLADRLDSSDAALACLQKAAQLFPQSPEVLTALARHAETMGRNDVAGDALARFATIASTEIAKRRAMVKRADILEATGAVQGARQCLEEAIDGALAQGLAPRNLIERLCAAYHDSGDHGSEARLWVRASACTSGAEAAAHLFRAGRIRESKLDDRRGAMAAYEAAAREAPDDIGLRRALGALAASLGDVSKADHHLGVALETATRQQLGDAVRALEAERERLHGTNGTSELWLDEVSSARRSMLDRSGRWAELAEFDEARAAVLQDPIARAQVLIEVGRMYLAAKSPAHRARAKEAFERAAQLDTFNVDALEALASLLIEEEAWAAASPIVQRLEALGGPPWPPPRFELVSARVAQAEGENGQCVARLLAGCLRDPGSIETRRELTSLAHQIGDPAMGEGIVAAYEAMLDPVLDVAALRTVHAERCLLALASKDTVKALREVERTLELDPSDERARKLRRRILEESGETHFLLDALEDEARESEPTAARRFLMRALDLAHEVHDARRGRRIAAALVRVAGDERRVWERLFLHYRVERDGAGMLQSAEALGDLFIRELTLDERAALIRACFDADRVADGARLLVSGESDSFVQRAVLALAEADEDAALPRLATRLLNALASDDSTWTGLALERLRAAVPDDKRVADRLVWHYGSDPSKAMAAAAIHREQLMNEPADPARIEALASLIGRNALGVVAAIEWLDHGRTALGRSTSSEGAEDPRFMGIAEGMAVSVDPTQGESIEVVDGVAVLGEALANEASPTELCFLLVRARERSAGTSEVEADRRALLECGDLAGAIRALRRLEPRTWAEQLDTKADRLACIRRWRPISDLFAFALSDTFQIDAASHRAARF